MTYYQQATNGIGSYFTDAASGLGALPDADTYPPGSEFALGYTLTGISAAQAPGAVQTLRDAVAYGFRGQLVSAVWGPAFGIPSGVMYATIRTGVQLTGAQLNGIGANIGGTLQGRLGSGVRVVNSYLHQVGGTASVAPQPPGTVPGMDMSTMPGMLPGIDPSTGLPYGQQPGFFSQTIGGIPTWALIGGGVAALGVVALSMRKKPSAPAKPSVSPNRRRRSRRNRHRHRSN